MPLARIGGSGMHPGMVNCMPTHPTRPTRRLDEKGDSSSQGRASGWVCWLALVNQRTFVTAATVDTGGGGHCRRGRKTSCSRQGSRSYCENGKAVRTKMLAMRSGISPLVPPSSLKVLPKSEMSERRPSTSFVMLHGRAIQLPKGPRQNQVIAIPRCCRVHVADTDGGFLKHRTLGTQTSSIQVSHG